MSHAEAFVVRIVERFSKGIVVKGILPRIETIKETTATLPAIEKRQLELETRLRLLLTLLHLSEEASRPESMNEEEQ